MPDEVYWIALGSALIVLSIVAFGGVDVRDLGDDGEIEAQRTVADVKGSTSPRRVDGRRQPAPRETGPPQAATNVLVVVAVRGDCWVSLRRESAAGEVLFEGLLTRGRRAQVRGGRIFVRLGAAANVDLTVAGKRRAIAPGTVDLVIDAGAST